MDDQPTTSRDSRPPRAFRFAVAAAVVGGIVLASCADDDSADDDSGDDAGTTQPATDSTPAPNDDSSATTASASEDETRTVESARGPIEVPADPQQIVALDPYVTLQTLDELDAPLVAAGSLGAETRAFVSEEAEELPSIGEGTELNYEAIAAAEPDLIVGLETYGEDVALLEDIAPTVLIPLAHWQENILEIADLVGEREAVQEELDELDARVEELGGEIEDAWSDGLELSLLRVPSDDDVRNYTTFLDNLMSSEILSRLPVTLTGDEQASGEDESYTEIPAESLEQVDADVILYYFGGGVLTTEEMDTARSNLLDNPLWPGLDAVADDSVHEVDAELWFTGANLLAADELLHDIEQHLTTGP